MIQMQIEAYVCVSLCVQVCAHDAEYNAAERTLIIISKQ